MRSNNTAFIRPVKRLVSAGFLVAAVGLAWGSSAARANLVIVPTFDPVITNDPNAAEIMAGFNAAAAVLESHIATNFTLNVTVTDMTPDLINVATGASSAPRCFLNYADYRAALASRPNLSANDVQALSTLPLGSNNPVDNTPYVYMPCPLGLALNLVTPEELALANAPAPHVYLNFPKLNYLRTGPQDPTRYDLQTIAEHELDELLGIGGAGGGDFFAGPGILDLYRYSAPGQRTTLNYATSSTFEYFSIDGGATNLINFHAITPARVVAGDFGDWSGNSGTYVQDYAGLPGTHADLAAPELTALDVVGWDLAIVPEPATASLTAPLVLLLIRRRKPMGIN